LKKELFEQRGAQAAKMFLEHVADRGMVDICEEGNAAATRDMGNKDITKFVNIDAEVVKNIDDEF
jgi:hypothetical protein